MGGRVVQGEVLEGDRGQVVALQGREVGGSGGLAEGETDVGQVGGDLGGGVGAWGRRGDVGGGLEDHGGGGGGVGDVGLILVSRREGWTSMPSEKEASLHNQQPGWVGGQRLNASKGRKARDSCAAGTECRRIKKHTPSQNNRDCYCRSSSTTSLL